MWHCHGIQHFNWSTVQLYLFVHPLTADIIMVEKVVSLERAKGTDDKPGSFGFSILGGAETKLLTEKVSVGSRSSESGPGG